MECNKEDGRRALDVAQRKLSEKDYNGAKRFVNKAQNLYPDLDGLKQVSTMIDVYIGGVKSDWYGILGVDPSADDETVKKHYKKLALCLHPDKNRFNGAEGAFKLVGNAWDLLSDKAKRAAYDGERKSEEVKQRKRERQPQHESASDKEKENAAEVERRWKRWIEESQKESAAAEEARVRREAAAAATARANENSTAEAERLFKKPMQTAYAYASYSTCDCDFKNPNSTAEAARLFKKTYV